MNPNARRVPFGPITGLDERHFPTPGSLSIATNLRTDNQGAWSNSSGLAVLFQDGQSPLAGLGEIETMTWFSQHQGGRQWLLWEQRTSTSSTLVDLVAFSGSQRSTNIVSGARRFHAGPWLKTQYMAHNDWLYYVNGYNAPERWNGRWKTRIGFDRAAGAPVPISNESVMVQDWLYPWWTQVSAGYVPGLVTSAFGMNVENRKGLGPRATNGDTADAPLIPVYYTYGYALTYLNDLNQESPPSPTRLMTGTTQGVDDAALSDYVGRGPRGFLVQLPDPPPHVKGMRLWRTQNINGLDPSSQVQANLYLHTELAAGIAGTITDLKSDAELGRILDRSQLGPFPNSARLLAMFRGRMFVAAAVGNTSTLVYSANGFIEQFPVDNVLPIGDADSGHITAMYPTKDALVVFKVRGIYLVRQQIDGYFRAETLTEDDGCSAAKTLVEVPGRGLLFVSTGGIRLLSGALANEGVPTRVEADFDQRVRETFQRRVSIGQLVTAFAVVNHDDREVWIQLPEDGKSRPSFGIVYHYGEDAWSVREGWNVSCGVETRDHRDVIYFGSNTADGGGVYQVYQYSNSVAADTQPFMKGAPMTKRGAQLTWTGASVYAVTHGSGRSLTMGVYINRQVRPLADYQEARGSIDTESRGVYEQWGTAVWDAGYWADLTVQPIRYSILPPGSPTDVQWSLTGTRFAVFGLDLEITPNEVHKIDANVTASWTTGG